VEMFPVAPAACAFIELASNLMLLPVAEKSGSNTLNELLQRLLQQKPDSGKQKPGHSVVQLAR
jgi:hypothetical protein